MTRISWHSSRRPVYALILVFPTTEIYESRVAGEDATLEHYAGCGVDEDVMFFKQTINNACGLYAILHAICNGTARKEIGMRRFFTICG